MIIMKIITATMAKNIATKMKECPELMKMMDTILCCALQGERKISVVRNGQSTEVWESYQTFFAGLGYNVINYPSIKTFTVEW